MKRRIILPSILTISLAMTPFISLAMTQKQEIQEQKPLSGFLRLLIAIGPDVLEILGLEGLGGGAKKLVKAVNELTKELKKKPIDPQIIKKTVKHLAEIQKNSELIQKDIKKLAKFLAKSMKFFAWTIPKKQKKQLITVKVKDKQGNIITKKITFGEYLKNAPDYLLNVNFWLTEKLQNLAKKLLGTLITQIEKIEKGESPATILKEKMKEIKAPIRSFPKSIEFEEMTQ